MRYSGVAMLKEKVFLRAFFVFLALCGGLFLLYRTGNPDFAGRCAGTQSGDRCWSDEIYASLDADDVPEALQKISAFSKGNTEFSSVCHGLMHLIGTTAYEDFKAEHLSPYIPEMSACSYGFFHGFMEALLADTHDPKGATAFCTIESTRGIPFPRDECFHGIGHGVTDEHVPADWKDVPKILAASTALCRSLRGTDHDFQKCAGGIYNAIANVYFYGEYGLGVHSADSLGVCRSVEGREEKSQCYSYMARILLKVPPGTFASALQLAQSVPPPEFAGSVVDGLSVFYAGRGDAVGEVMRSCSLLPVALLEACTRGYAIGLVQRGALGSEQQDAFAFCGSFEDGTHRGICFRAALTELQKRWLSEKFKHACDPVQGGAHDSCALALRGVLP